MLVVAGPLALVALAAVAVCWRRCAVLGGICAAGALACWVAVLAGAGSELTLAALALLGLGGGVTIVGEIVWRLLADEDGSGNGSSGSPTDPV